MVAAVRVHKTGGPEALTYEQIDLAAPGPGQIKIKQHAAGVNYIDTYFRMGMYPSPVGSPFISGSEGAGEVIAVGPGGRDESGKLIPIDLKAGDRVLFGKWSGTEVKLDGEDLLIMKEADIMGVIA